MTETKGVPEGDDWMVESLGELDRAARRCNFSFAETSQLRLLLIQLCRLDEDAHEIIPVSAYLRNMFVAGTFDVPNLQAIDALLPGAEQALQDHMGFRDRDAFHVAMVRQQVKTNPGNVLPLFTDLLNKAQGHAAS